MNELLYTCGLFVFAIVWTIFIVNWLQEYTESVIEEEVEEFDRLVREYYERKEQ
jgi:hypothetical protein